MKTSPSKDKRDALLYNLLPGERQKIAAFQGGRDPITGDELKPYAQLDHDHRTGLIRGLLNPLTNRFLIDDVDRLEASVRYLVDPPAVKALGERVYGLMGKAKRKKKMRYGPSGTPEPAARKNATTKV